MAVSCMLGGCATHTARHIGDPPVAYPWADDETALAELRARAERLSTVQATCEIVLTQRGRTVRLDGALVARFPSQMRLRTWKLGSAMFDAAMVDSSTYVYDATGEGNAGAMMGRALADLCELLGPGLIARTNLERAGGPMRLRGTLRDGRVVTCEVDRATLAIRRFVMGEGVEMALRDHRKFDGMLWATTSVLTSPEGTVEVRYTDVALNVELADAALAPSSRARLVP